MDSSFLADLFKLGLVAVLVLANGFFVMAEFALVSVRRTRIEQLVSQGNATARVVSKAVNDPDRFIAATQLGITIASLGLGWIGEPAIAHLLQPLIERIPGPWQEAASHSMAVGTSFAIITFLHVVIGELAPKSIALQNPERASLLVARPTLWTERLFAPFIWALNGTGNALLRMLGIEPASGHQLVHSAAEIRMLVAASAQVGAIEAGEQEMVEAVFDLAETYARQVMIPRTEMACIQADASLSEAIDLAAQTLLTKFPVYEENLDHIIGILHTKDLVKAMHTGQEDVPVRGLVREAIFVPESIRVGDLLAQFRQRRQHIAILLDEYAGTAGLVTLEDLLEELVGDVQDVFDQPEPQIRHMSDGSVLIAGLALIEEVNGAFGLNLVDPNYDTIAGYVLGRLGRIGAVGDVVEAINSGRRLRFRVEAMEGLRIALIRLDIADVKPPRVEE
jgi:CBS domain containing-hemolysin-like protein